jgi:radical SAM protein with 4Fe4S-binding SPASM domain
MVITGGEPFLHADILAMIQLISDKGFPFAILTNGTRLTASVAEQLKAYDNLTYVQVSLDGMSRGVHSITRADSYEKTMRGIRLLIEFELPFSLAPTIHEGNLHEIYDIAHYAIANGGGFTPNNLRKFPHDANSTLSLSNDSLYRVMREINNRLVCDFGAKNIEQIRARNRIDFNPNRCRNDKSVCGIAYSIVDLNWNGDVYPCNLLRQDEFKLGNLQVCDFEDIFKKAETLRIRTRSCDIPKCRECELVSICGGGCRAGAFYNYGSFLREDDLCDVLYRSNLDWRLIQKGAVDERP